MNSNHDNSYVCRPNSPWFSSVFDWTEHVSQKANKVQLNKGPINEDPRKLGWFSCKERTNNKKMKDKIWKSNMDRKLKLRFVRAWIGSVLLYDNVWLWTHNLLTEIDGSYTRLNRRMLDSSWREHITNKELDWGHGCQIHLAEEIMFCWLFGLSPGTNGFISFYFGYHEGVGGPGETRMKLFRSLILI